MSKKSINKKVVEYDINDVGIAGNFEERLHKIDNRLQDLIYTSTLKTNRSRSGANTNFRSPRSQGSFRNADNSDYDENMEEIFVQLQNVTEKFTEYCSDTLHSKHSHNFSLLQEGTHQLSYHTPIKKNVSSTPIRVNTPNGHQHLPLPSYTMNKNLEDGLPHAELAIPLTYEEYVSILAKRHMKAAYSVLNPTPVTYEEVPIQNFK